MDSCNFKRFFARPIILQFISCTVSFMRRRVLPSPQIIAIDEHILWLKDEAPELRVSHLISRREEAKSKGQLRKANDIDNIINREALRGRYSDVKRTTFERKGGEAIEAVAGQTIGERYRLAYSAPIMANPQLLQDVGFAGDGDASESILHGGTYEFPLGTDEYTKLLMLEAAVMFCSLGESEIEDMVHRHDFQNFWKSAREKTESSYSRCHFGHYVSASHDNVLSDLHVTSLNTFREIGIAPSRWRNAITVLLEKVFGNRFIDRLRAISVYSRLISPGSTNLSSPTVTFSGFEKRED
eukprot:scaffold32390_cov56-Cyclotella_meneghiniana.AAC.2